MSDQDHANQFLERLQRKGIPRDVANSQGPVYVPGPITPSNSKTRRQIVSDKYQARLALQRQPYHPVSNTAGHQTPRVLRERHVMGRAGSIGPEGRVRPHDVTRLVYGDASMKERLLALQENEGKRKLRLPTLEPERLLARMQKPEYGWRGRKPARIPEVAHYGHGDLDEE